MNINYEKYDRFTVLLFSVVSTARREGYGRVQLRHIRDASSEKSFVSSSINYFLLFRRVVMGDNRKAHYSLLTS